MKVNNSLTFKLIDGDFTAEEARDILLALVNHKISHHEMNAFSNQVRFNKKPSVDRLEILKQTREKIKAHFASEEPDAIISMFSEIALTSSKAAVK